MNLGSCALVSITSVPAFSDVNFAIAAVASAALIAHASIFALVALIASTFAWMIASSFLPMVLRALRARGGGCGELAAG